jgi:hypothetical protein
VVDCTAHDEETLMSNDNVAREETRRIRHPGVLIAGIVTADVIATAGAVGTIAARTGDTARPRPTGDSPIAPAIRMKNPRGDVEALRNITFEFAPASSPCSVRPQRIVRHVPAGGGMFSHGYGHL